jgi:hypothetical protein
MAASGARSGLPSPRGRASSWPRTLAAAVLSLTVAATGTPVRAAGPSSDEVERLYVEGQQRAEGKDYRGAADSWTRLLSVLGESGENQAIRESVIINVLDAHLKAYNQLVDENGNKDVTHLRSGKATLDTYYADFKRVHGDRIGISAAVQDKAAELERALEAAEREAKARGAGSGGTSDTGRPDDTEVLPEGSNPGEGSDKKVIVLQAQSSGTGLIVGGTVLAVLGAGTLTMIPVGSILAKRAEDDFENAMTQADQDDAERRGRSANAILITGAVLTPLLWGGAAAMIVFGVRTRRRAREEQRRALETVRATPSVGPHFSGFTLSGRF